MIRIRTLKRKPRVARLPKLEQEEHVESDIKANTVKVKKKVLKLGSDQSKPQNLKIKNLKVTQVDEEEEKTCSDSYVNRSEKSFTNDSLLNSSLSCKLFTFYKLT